MRRIRAVVFDLDDTLYPEREYAWSGFRAVAAAFVHDLGDTGDTVADLQRLFDSEHRTRVFDALLKERFGGVDRALLQRMIQTYRQHPPVITPYPEVDAALARLRVSYKLGIITDGRSEAQWAKIDVLTLRPRFDAIIVTGDWKSDTAPMQAAGPDAYAKPNPRAFEEIARQIGVSASSCAYVADNLAKDFVAPNALGWLTVRVARPGGVYCDAVCAQKGQAAHTIKSLDELDAILDQGVKAK